MNGLLNNDNLKAKAEQAAWDNDLVERGKYSQLYPHSPYAISKLEENIKDFFSTMNGKVLLEIGSNAWIDYIIKYAIKPAKLICLNISTKELEIGINFVKNNKINFPVEFIICDANKLPLNKNYFDGVFGGAILHHLNFSRAVDEVHRVCKLNGEILFHEPLGMNPVSKIIRKLTPNARTVDEMPLNREHLNLINQKFKCKGYYSQLFSVLAVVISKYIYKDPNNIINQLFFNVDELIKIIFPPIKYLYREVLLTGKKLN